MSARRTVAPTLARWLTEAKAPECATRSMRLRAKEEWKALNAVARAAEQSSHTEGWGDGDWECEHGAPVNAPCPDYPGQCSGDALRSLVRALSRLRGKGGT